MLPIFCSILYRSQAFNSSSNKWYYGLSTMQELYYEIEKTQKNLREFIIMNEAETAHKNQKEI